MIGSILKLLNSALTIWEHKEVNKYRDRLMELKRDYYEESKKEPRDNARLDNIEFELLILSDSVSAEIERSKA